MSTQEALALPRRKSSSIQAAVPWRSVEIEKTGQVLVRTCSTKRRHPAGRIALSVVPNRAQRPGERPRHVRLLGEARLYQEHACIGLGDQVLRSSGHNDHALIRFDPWAVARSCAPPVSAAPRLVDRKNRTGMGPHPCPKGCRFHFTSAPAFPGILRTSASAL
jgi:hypothetical protein